MIFIDAHVHIYSNALPVQIFNASLLNFKKRSNICIESIEHQYVLMLAERDGYNFFEHCLQYDYFEDLNGQLKNLPSRWFIHSLTDENSIVVESDTGDQVIIISGKQIVTNEQIEILALGTRKAFDSGNSINDTVKKIMDAGGIPVIPWGFGKWTGHRLELLNTFLKEKLAADVFWGDNGGRPEIISLPSFLKDNYGSQNKMLSGSDPLPFLYEYKRIGSFGTLIKKTLSEMEPCNDLKSLLYESKIELEPYGQLKKTMPFLFSQFTMFYKNKIGFKNRSNCDS